ncbi:MAG: T9SS C-terminal target domain-containing protein [Gemmatimonadetes bacterium]|nr:MAG: T9SS C-terminal target domain-containing protein [Gemmatimonadota bacterium]
MTGKIALEWTLDSPCGTAGCFFIMVIPPNNRIPDHSSQKEVPMSYVLSMLIFFCLLFPVHAQEFAKNIVGYYTSWSVYARNYHVPDIPADQVTHINYAFANIDPTTGTIQLGDPYADIDRYYEGDCWDEGCLRGSFHQLQLLKAAHPHLKTLISVGGWTWSTYFSDIALTEESRSTFAASCVEFIQEYEFDGVDIDWEYPVCCGDPGNIYRPEDRENFTLLLAELREQLDDAGNYLLTIAAPAAPHKIENLEVELLHEYLDWINLMSYDLHGPWGGEADAVTHFNAPLFIAEDDPLEEPYHSAYTVDAAVQAYLSRGVPPEKLHVGLAFYGRGYGGVPNENNGLFTSYWGAAPAGTWENGVFDFWDLATNYVETNGYSRYWHDGAHVPWLYNPETQIMISYDDSISIQQKCAYINLYELGGSMFWEFSADRNHTLLETVYHTLNSAIVAVPHPPDQPVIHSPMQLHPNYPNPFNPQTAIRFDLPEGAPVYLAIYDLGGRLVTVLVDEYRQAGQHAVIWSGTDQEGRPVQSGVYGVRLQVGSTVVSGRKLILLR